MFKTQKRVLFICTGNYYRSRFAEALFNHLCHARNMQWRAFSRGLAIDLAAGDLSPYALAELKRRNIPLDRTTPTRTPLARADLASAEIVIALREIEHRPLLQRHFKQWADKIRYWNIGDVDVSTPAETFGAIEAEVSGLIKYLGKTKNLRSTIRQFFSRGLFVSGAERGAAR